MTRTTLIAIFFFCLVASGTRAQETFPGQADLAAGLACHRNLDLKCARARLEKALAAFSPENDPAYLQHVRAARWVLTQIHVARDDLGSAERELTTLLLVDPAFALPPGDHPPKLRYVFDKARAKLAAQTKPPDKNPDPPKDDPPKDDPPKDPPGIEQPAPPPPAPEPYRLSIGARVIGLFGDDADLASTGPGADLSFSWLATRKLSIGVGFHYAYHAVSSYNTALQTMSLALSSNYELDLNQVGLRIGGGLGVLAMGTQDRYDHWGFTLAGSVALVWPRQGFWGLVAELRPSVVVTADGGSFYLPAGLAVEVRW